MTRYSLDAAQDRAEADAGDDLYGRADRGAPELCAVCEDDGGECEACDGTGLAS